MRGESVYSKRLGKKVAHSKFSLVDDPTMDGGLGSSPFDDEGEPSRAFRPIKNGVLASYLFDRGGASEFGKKPTGSAMRMHPFDGRSYKSPPGISARNVRVEAPSIRTKKLLAGIDDGLLLHDMMGVHTANTVSGDFSVTSTVLFRIRKGALEGPVAPVSIAGNLHAALKAGITLGDDIKQTSGEAAISIPSVRFDGFSVTP
jgi:PmbA protein